MICARKDCRDTAEKVPVLYMPAFKNGPEAMIVMRELAVCASCRNGITIDDIVSEPGWDSITLGLVAAGYVKPPRKLARIEWTKL